MEFRLLGPLEARVGDLALPLGGPKQLAVLAVLLLRTDEVVAVERLIDEVWGDSPPESAAHSLEAYVSRLRQVLPAPGPTLARRGTGYLLDLGDAILDAQVFAELADDASQAAAAGDHERASELARDALALWRGPALADVALGPAGRAERERLEELRLRTLEQRFDAELALGHDEDLVGELQVLVGQNPYRERFVSQLMLALYRSGRQADALDVYEKTRAVLADDLGLQPSEELQQLSGRIVRQEPQLGRPPITGRVSRGRKIRSNPRAVALAFGAIALMLAFTASGSASHKATAASTPSSTRVALVLPRAAGAGDELMILYRNRLAWNASLNSELSTRTFVANEGDHSPSALAALAARLRAGRFGLVLFIGDGAGAQALAPLVRGMPRTKFVFVDASLERLSLNGIANASAVRFAEEETSELAGYLSGLVAPRGRPARERADVVSVVGGIHTSQTERTIAGFRRGVRSALPGTQVLVDYSDETDDPTRCEQIANSQIDQGADVVFAVAGKCGSGALVVARTRGVWGAGNAESAVESVRLQMLVSTGKEHEWAIDIPVDRFLRGTLPAGRDLVLGLDDDYAVGIIDTNSEVPPAAVSKMVRRCSAIRQRAHSDPG
jgi:DNA-binding SARP family transcriptional activator/basic membrane lipoprotein Med (substrate-binding protein (PBP1-ABC) superfamily)